MRWITRARAHASDSAPPVSETSPLRYFYTRLDRALARYFVTRCDEDEKEEQEEEEVTEILSLFRDTVFMAVPHRTRQSSVRVISTILFIIISNDKDKVFTSTGRTAKISPICQAQLKLPISLSR